MLLLLITDAAITDVDARVRDESFRDRCGRLVALCNTIHGVRQVRFSDVDGIDTLALSVADGVDENSIRREIDQLAETLEVRVGDN